MTGDQVAALIVGVLYLTIAVSIAVGVRMDRL